MLVPKEKIMELLPQRPPMVMVDELVMCNEMEAVSRLFIRDDNIFLGETGFSPSGMLEAMAQTAAARTGYLLKKQQESANKSIPVGVIGSIKNFKLHFQPGSGDTIFTTVFVEHEVLQATVIRAKVEVEGRLSAESTLQIFLSEEQAKP